MGIHDRGEIVLTTGRSVFSQPIHAIFDLLHALLYLLHIGIELRNLGVNGLRLVGRLMRGMVRVQLLLHLLQISTEWKTHRQRVFKLVLVALDVHEDFFVCALSMLFVREASCDDLDARNAGFEFL